ncbi:hypothetical protein [Legionella fallonii]|uniref:Macro domain-containing protein n=1 Tax=Legionella fallonii LLAP-10 TaxID=1212491 RepID=A0A098FZC1_9GAMM|nr:hypothetical protein [Legionella fallonii]CEG55567.1 protein of unknown function [Legionella fallonii LLAP-10]
MPRQLNYTQYYQEQMDFLVRYLENHPLNHVEQTRAQRIKNKLARQQVHFTDDFLAITPGDELLATRIGYVPPNGTNISLLAPDKDRANGYRHLTRQRLVYGPVDFYLGGQLDSPTEIPVITTCAINLMGTSPYDSARFNPNGIFNATEYQKECNKLADFIVSAAKQHGHQRLVMPAFGVGLYIKTIDSTSQIKARDLMYRAFAMAAQKHQLQVDWIVWAKDTKNDPVRVQQDLSVLSNPYISPIIHADFLQYGQELLAKNVDAVLLNAGSDRTVGGHYTANKGSMERLPVEEQMTQQSDLAVLHTEYNSVMADNFRKQVVARRQSIAQPKPPVVHISAPYTPLAGANDNALAIKNYLGVNEHPWVLSNGTDYKISFKGGASAQALVNKGQGLNLRVIQEGSYSAVYLSASLYQNLIQQAKQAAPVHQHNSSHITPSPQPIVTQPTPYTELQGGRDNALAIKSYLGLSEHPWVLSNGTDYKISFKSQASAQTLLDKRQDLGLQIKQEGAYYAVYLTARLYRHVLQQAKQTASMHQHNSSHIVPPPQPIVTQPTPYTELLGGRDNALAIKGHLGLSEHPWILSNGTDYKISFKSQASAQTLLDKRQDLGLQIKQEGSYYAVYLTAGLYQNIVLRANQPVRAQHHALEQEPPRPVHKQSLPPKVVDKISSETVDDTHPIDKPDLANQLTISAVRDAVKKYQEWYRGDVNHRGPNGFFSWLRHGSTGQKRAVDLVAQITSDGADIEEILNDLLKNPSTAYHRHSLSSFLLDELSKIEGSSWYGLAPNKTLLYDQHKVVEHLELVSPGVQQQG